MMNYFNLSTKRPKTLNSHHVFRNNLYILKKNLLKMGPFLPFLLPFKKLSKIFSGIPANPAH